MQPSEPSPAPQELPYPISSHTSAFENFYLNADGSSKIHIGNNFYQGQAPIKLVERCLRSLWFEEIHLKRESMNRETEGTCNWIIEQPEYIEWSRSSSAILWIRGAPGAGKSTLMKFIISQPDRTRQNRNCDKVPSEIMLCHFFRRDGSDLERSLEGMARSLLCQLLQAFPTHLKILLEDFKIKAVGIDLEREKVKWGPQRLLQLLESSIGEVQAMADIRILIDAVDECDEHNARKFLNLFQRITRLDEGKQDPPIKKQLAVCYSCRNDAFINYDTSPSIEVEQQNHGDIRRHVKEALSERDLSLSSYDTQILIDHIGDRADGIFLWATLVVEQMIKDIERRMPIEQVIAVSGQLPAELTDLYRQIILRLKEEHAAQSLNLFQWACCWEVPGAQLDSMSTDYGFMHTISTDRAHFSLDSLRAFMNFRPRKEAPPTAEARSLFIFNNEMMKYQIKKLSGGLAYPTDRLPLVHSSIRDFLFREGFRILDSTYRSHPLEVLPMLILGTIHARLAHTCVSFLEEFTENSIESDMSPQVTADAKRQPSSYVPESMKDPVKYALTHAFAHASRAEKYLSGGYSEIFSNRLAPVLQREAAWIRLLNQELGDGLKRVYSFSINRPYGPRSASMHPKKKTPSLVASLGKPVDVLYSFLPEGKGIFSLLATLYDLASVLRRIIPIELESLHNQKQAIESDAYNEMLYQLLCMAAEEDLRSLVSTFVDKGIGTSSNRRTSDSENPVLLAAKNGHFASAQLLMKIIPLDESMLCALISHSIAYDMCASLATEVDLNNKNHNALIAAVYAGRIDLLKLFHLLGADFNAKGSVGGCDESSALSPLEAAIGGRCEFDVVKTLLECGADVGDTRADGNSYIVNYTLECIEQARATDGAREKRWSIFKFRRPDGKTLDALVEAVVRPLEQVLPLLQKASRPSQPTNVVQRTAIDDIEQQHQDEDAVKQSKKRSGCSSEVWEGSFTAKKHKNG